MEFFKEENRLVTILRNIETQSAIEIDKLAGRINVSTKTIRNDIKDLNALFSGYATISNNKGICKLIVFDQKGYDTIRNKIFEQNDLFNSAQTRMAYIFWQLMQADHPYLTDDLSEEMKVGRTTTINDLNKLRKILADYNLNIEGKANTGLRLVGDEIKIRFFILENVYEHLFLNFPLGQQIRDLLDDFQDKLALDALGFGFFYRFLVIMIHRIETGHKITTLEPKYMELYGSDAYKIADEFLYEVEQMKGYLIPKEERIYLCISLAGMRTPADTSEIEQQITISEDIADLIIDIINRIQSELSVTIVANELFDDFVYHIFFMINRLKYGFHIHNQMVDDFKDRYSLAYKMAEIAKDVIEEQTDIKMTEDEMGFIAAYFGVFLIEQEPPKECCKIAIICGSGKIIGRLIQNQLKRIFDTEPEFEFFYNGVFDEYRKNDFDYIVTTTELNLDTSTPVIYVEEVFNQEYIQKKFENIKYLSEAGCTMRKGIDSLFLNLLDESKFFILDPSITYTENVDFMMDILHSQGDLDDDFARRMHEREQTASMILHENAAFPHTYNQLTKLTLALGVYPESPMEEAHKKIKLVILLGIPENMQTDAVIIRLYDEILSLVQDIKVMTKIQHMESYRELLLYFTEENQFFK
jgi:lichenan operon transcriptional antiterminator